MLTQSINYIFSIQNYTNVYNGKEYFLKYSNIPAIRFAFSALFDGATHNNLNKSLSWILWHSLNRYLVSLNVIYFTQEKIQQNFCQFKQRYVSKQTLHNCRESYSRNNNICKKNPSPHFMQAKLKQDTKICEMMMQGCQYT